MTNKNSFDLEIRYDSQDLASSLQALAQELTARGHHVSTKCTASRLASSVEEIARSASNLKEIAENGVQLLKDAIAPIVAKATDRPPQKSDPETSKSNDKTANSSASNDENSKQTANSTQNGAFDAIGPSAMPSDSDATKNDENRAVIVTSLSCLNDTAWDTLRIGLIPQTGLKEAWLPNALDAIVIPSPSFRPYLELVNWQKDRIFDGGYPVTPNDLPSLSHDDALQKFGLNSNLGPIVLAMASGFRLSEMQTLMTQLSLLPKTTQIFLYHGGDSAKADALRTIAQRQGINARMFGKTDKLSNYLVIADVAIANADDPDLILLENAAIPCVISAQNVQSPIADFLVHENAARSVPRMYNIASAVNPLLSDVNALNTLRGAASRIAAQASVLLCADAIEAALADKDRMTHRPDRVASECGFEIIGNAFLPNTPQPFASPFAQNTPSTVIPPSSVNAPSREILMPDIPGAPSLQPTQNVVQAQTPIMPQTQMPLSPVQTPNPSNVLKPTLNFSSKKELEKAYTNLILAERNLEKNLDAISNAVNEWELRLDLAKQNQRDDLIASATQRLNDAKAEELRLMTERDALTEQKNALRTAARNFNSPSATSLPSLDDFDLGTDDPWRDDPLEAEFKRLQAENALRELRNKMK